MQGLIGWLAPSGVGDDEARNATREMLAMKPAHAGYIRFGNCWCLGADSERSLADAEDASAVIVGRPQLVDSTCGNRPPAAVLLELWRRHGRDAPKHIHGSFSFAVVDHREGSVFLCIDRVGTHSLAFASTGDGLAFATRADAVAAHPRVGLHLDPQGLFNYFYFHVVPAPGTIFRGIEKLEPAQWVQWRAGRVERGCYWRLHFRDEERSDFDEQAARLRTILKDCVARAKGDDDVAAFLSGGTDSSTVCGLLSGLTTRPQRTYSIGFQADGFDEMEYSRIAAKQFGLDAREYYLKPEDILTAIPIIATHYDEPFGNDSAVPSYFCARLAAADGFRIMLAGDGGDEIFGGNTRYAKQKLFERYVTIPRSLRKSVIEPLAAVGALQGLLPVRKMRSYIRQANVPLPDRLQAYNFVHRQALDKMFSQEFLAEVDTSLSAAWLRASYQGADTNHFINRMLHLDLKFTLADNDLRKVNGMTEAAGVEVRYPLLDDAIIEFSGDVPPGWKVRGQKLRWFWKRSLKGFLPDPIINKTKHGFGLPFGLWARECAPLYDCVEDHLTDFAKRSILQPAYIDQIRKEHTSGHATYFGTMVWLIIILQEWMATRRL